MRTYLVRSYWRNEGNPDEILVTKATVEATDVSDAYNLGEPTPEATPVGYIFLNWVVFE